MALDTVIRGAVLGDGRPVSVRVSSGIIATVAPDLQPVGREAVLDLGGLALLPGLINAHDHLNLDLLPPLGNPPYPNSYAWHADLKRDLPAAAIQHRPVGEIDRIRWGAYRNLFSGVTTVAHHGQLPIRFMLGADLPVRLRLPMAWADSLRDGPHVARRARHSRNRMPFAIHLAEGVDATVATELDELERIGGLGPGTIIVHGVGLDSHDMRRLADSGASLVWCPRSNHFLFGTTAAVEKLPASVPVALATDSTMTGSVTLFDEARFAVSLGKVNSARVLGMVTEEAARVLGLPDRGRIGVGAAADLIAVPHMGDAASTLLAARPKSLGLVMIGGQVRLAAQRPRHGYFETITLDGARRFVTPGLLALRDRIAATLPPDFHSPTLAQLT